MQGARSTVRSRRPGTPECLHGGGFASTLERALGTLRSRPWRRTRSSRSRRGSSPTMRKCLRSRHGRYIRGRFGRSRSGAQPARSSPAQLAGSSVAPRACRSRPSASCRQSPATRALHPRFPAPHQVRLYRSRALLLKGQSLREIPHAVAGEIVREQDPRAGNEIVVRPGRLPGPLFRRTLSTHAAQRSRERKAEGKSRCGVRFDVGGRQH